MIIIKNVRDHQGNVSDIEIESSHNISIDGAGLTCLPALVDTHVHFREPGHSHKEDWGTAAQAAIEGGVTTVFDMPNNNPPCITLKNLHLKKALIDKKLSTVDIPLRYHLYFGADCHHFDEIPKCRNQVVGIKVFMGSSTGTLLVNKQNDLERVFEIAASEDMIISVHAEDEEIISQNSKKFSSETDPSVHSKIRHPDAAKAATAQAIALAEKYGTRLCILHMSTKEEIELVREAKARGVKVYAEATPHHLFLDDSRYRDLGTKVQVNPPLRSLSDQEALWIGIQDDTIDFIGTDHAPHTLEEKQRPYGSAPSGVPSIELLLPLLLNAYNHGLLTLEQIIKLTRTRAEEVFRLEPHSDVVLVDLDLEKRVDDGQLKTKCQWSPYHGQVLKGWPVCTILKGNIYEIEAVQCQKL
ncbi:MAG: Dihydroorotase [Chlamydiae bacterium]|nr:Dihydroorotase [Chlamydiota bacterium]